MYRMEETARKYQPLLLKINIINQADHRQNAIYHLLLVLSPLITRFRKHKKHKKMSRDLKMCRSSRGWNKKV